MRLYESPTRIASMHLRIESAHQQLLQGLISANGIHHRRPIGVFTENEIRVVKCTQQHRAGTGVRRANQVHPRYDVRGHSPISDQLQWANDHPQTLDRLTGDTVRHVKHACYELIPLRAEFALDLLGQGHGEQSRRQQVAKKPSSLQVVGIVGGECLTQ